MSDLLVRTVWNLRFRGKKRLLSPLVPNTGTRTGNVFGTRLPLDLSDYVQRMIYLGCFERDETELILRELKPGHTFVDIGANVGYFSYLAASKIGPGGRVIAIEPSPYVGQILSSAVAANDLKTVTVIRTALGRTPGELTLYLPPESHHNHAPTAIPNPGWTPSTVPVQRLDDLLAAQKVEQVDVLKIDVEGYEGEVLAGAESWLRAGRIKVLLVELNEWAQREVKSSSKELWDWIAGCGYEAHIPQPAVFGMEKPLNVLFRAKR